MLFTCPQGCEVEIGMSRAREGLHRCEAHKEVLVYGKPMGRSAGTTKPKPRKAMKRSLPKRDWTDARRKVDEEEVCRVCGSNEQVQAAHVIGRASDVQKGPALWVNPDSIVPLCGEFSQMKCHARYDQHEIDVLQVLTLEEQVQAVRDADSLVAAHRRTAPSSFRILQSPAEREGVV